MMAASGVRFLTSLFSVQKLNVGPNIYCGTVLQTRHYALRKGTREKKLKQKLRNIALKRAAPPDPWVLRKKKMITREPPDAVKFPVKDIYRISPDDVWLRKYYSMKSYSFEEAIQCHREILHPTMYNCPNASIKASIELSMEGTSKKNLVSSFNGLIGIPHKFEIGEKRSILVFAKNPEEQEEARDAGAAVVAGPDFIRLIRIGEMSFAEFHAVIAHPSILADLITIKGIMKNKFPSLKLGTLGPDIKSIIHKHLYGIKYSVTPNLHFPLYGSTEITFGTLDMDMNHLKENFRALVDDIESHRPKRPGPFILRIILKCPPNRELIKINLSDFIKEVEHENDEDSEDEDTVAKAEI